MLRDALHHPRKLWIRRALFQVHLWLGVLLSVYVAIIGLSGSILVWEEEVEASAYHLLADDPAHFVSMDAAVQATIAHYPGETPTYVMRPQPHQPVYSIYLQQKNKETRTVHVNATTGTLLPERRTFMDWDHDLHVYLLRGRTGFILNCIAGIGLLILAITGVVLWWPGIRLWLRGFVINLRHSWKRINYDAHNAVGIWTLGIVSLWGISAIAFLAPVGFQKTVNAIAPLKAMNQPMASTPQHLGAPLSIGSIAQRAQSMSPQTPLSGIAIPAAPTGKYTAYLDARTTGDFSHRLILTLAADGQLLSTWHYGENKTLGDWIVWSIYPLHFGTLWGTPVKVVWTVLGMSLPILSLTGLLMYWNRYLRRVCSGTSA